MTQPVRDRTDLCPGVLRPWPAEDGPLVRIRLVGGLLSASQLSGLMALAGEYGDGNVHLTKRANVQVRAVFETARFADELETLGLLPSRSHELVRNIVVSPRGDRLRPLAERFDQLLCAAEELSSLPARFLFSFDDRGDLSALAPDLGVLADGSRGRLVIGGRLGADIALRDVPHALVELAHRFLAMRGSGPSAAWHVVELARELEPAPDAYVGQLDPEGQLDVPEGLLTPAVFKALPPHDSVVVTPWRGLVVR